ncbi:alpha/beta fold hydrolase [Leptolyngbya iicbica]|uniref:Alpha/beta fold hydrolase n=2 Tax=Cyanophyceae TaxID=3028117 RepID=A0A4Q7EA82_9CYAN|nr:alpha/beta fold hydrolase [Leptolyngbya sp. LK]RZM77905.1 alpha/beta fold hydrolase [Leptolyngbya sp. LK]
MKSSVAPSLFAPVLPQLDKPLLLLLPGLDGTGQLFVSQVPTLARDFDVRCLTIPPDNRQDWPALAQAVIRLMQEAGGDRPIYVCGESFGGCLALQVALLAPARLTHLVLVNPASALRRSVWVRWLSQYTSTIPEWLFQTSGAIALPLLANLERISQDKRDLFTRTVRPISQACVAWRIAMLNRFDVSQEQLSRLRVPTSLLASGRDRLLPSYSEAQLLQKSLPQAQIYALPESGHVCLLEDTVNLSRCLEALNVLPVSQDVAPVVNLQPR